MAFCQYRRDFGWDREAPSLKPPKENTVSEPRHPDVAGIDDRPTCRMGPPLRSSAADAYYCIMVQIPVGSTEYKYVARCSAPNWRAPLKSSKYRYARHRFPG